MNTFVDDSKLALRKMKLAPGTVDTRLAVSRDGIKFERPAGRGPFLPTGPDGGMFSRIVWAMPNPIRAGDEIWIYYVGANFDHEKFLDPVSPKEKTAMGRAVMRLDGFVSLDAGYQGGEFTTPLLKFTGGQMYLNLDAGAGGSARVEILDANGKPIEGFAQDDASVLYGNSTKMPVRWEGNCDVSALAGKAVKLRFVMRDCKLYAFQFASD